MTPSSTSEPDETTELTSEKAAPDVAAASTTEAVPTAEPTTKVQPVAPTVPIAKDQTVALPADEGPATKAEPVPSAESADPAESATPAESVSPAESKPVEPAPTESAPVEPVQSEPVQPEPIQSAPVQSEPVEVAAPTEIEAVDDGDESDRPDDEDGDDEDGDYDEVLGTDPEPSNRYPTLIPLVGSLLALTAVAALMLVAFALPAIKSSPNKLPIGVAGSAEFQGQVREALSQEGLHPFEITGYSKESELRSAILDREVYGGLSLGTASVSMLVSSGASPVAAQTLNSLANSLAQGGIPVSDVAPLPKSDPRGEGLAAANLPLVIASILPALILIPLYRRRPAAQLGVTVGAAVLIGLGLSAVLSFALGSTEDSNFLLVSVGLAAGVLATSLVLLGLFAVAGRIGAGIGAAALVLLGAPLTGLSTAPEWLPNPWGDLGQLLPTGANASLLRSTAYFDGNGGGRPALVLAAWALLGLLLIGASWLLARSRTQEPAAEPESSPQELVLEQPATV